MIPARFMHYLVIKALVWVVVCIYLCVAFGKCLLVGPSSKHCVDISEYTAAAVAATV